MVLFWIALFSVAIFAYYVLWINARMAVQYATQMHAASFAGVAEPQALPEPAPDPDPEPDPDYLDMTAFERPPSVPALQIQPDEQQVYRGGAAGAHPNVFANGAVDLNGTAQLTGDRRQVRRRLLARRAEDLPGGEVQRSGQDNRLAPRRVWLRRKEDEVGLDLVDIEEAGRILSAAPELIDKWMLTADLPFYMVTRGAIRKKRFDRIELLGWLGAEDVMEARARAKQEED